MMCHRIGWPPISIIALGRSRVCSANRVPRPPARIATFIAPPGCKVGGDEQERNCLDYIGKKTSSNILLSSTADLPKRIRLSGAVATAGRRGKPYRALAREARRRSPEGLASLPRSHKIGGLLR